MLAVEIDGAVHRIKGRFKADLERHNLAQLLGWLVLRFSPADVKSGRALGVLEALFAGDEFAALAAVQGR
jgi:very-short-patch-repair endonuclease